MLRKSIVRMTVFISLLALVLTAACSSSNPSGDSAAKAGEPSAVPDGSSSSPAAANGKYNPPYKLTTVWSIAPAFKFLPGQSIENNAWTKAIQDQLGINLKTLWTAPSGNQYSQKLNVTIASNDIPDLMVVSDTTFKQLLEDGKLADLTDAYNKYASPLLKKIVETDGGKQFSVAKSNGKIMALPYVSSTPNSSLMWYVRKDWLDKLGLPIPKTLQDLTNVMDAFTKRDPDGNGKNDTYGTGTIKTLLNRDQLVNGVMIANHAYPNMWIKGADGQLVDGTIQPETKAALGQLAEWYKAGYIDKEFAVKDQNKVNQDIAAGKFGVWFGNQSAPIGILAGSVKNKPEADWIPIPVVSADGQQAKSPVSIAPGQFAVVRAGVEHPEAAVKLANMYVETFFGSGATSKETYANLITDQIDDGKGGKQIIQKFFYAPIRITDPNKNLNAYQHLLQAVNSKDPSKLTIEEKTYYDDIVKYMDAKDTSAWPNYRVFGSGGSLSVTDLYSKINQYMDDEYLGPTTPTMADKLPTLNQMEEQEFTKIVMGAAPLSEFDKFVADWKSLGGDQIAKEVNDWYKQNK